VTDRVVVNGVLRTQDPARPQAEALAVSSGRIVAVGSRTDIESLARAGTKRIDLEGGTLLPGFYDSHVHVWKVGQLQTHILDLRRVSGLEELLSLVRERDRSLPEGAWLLGRGYNEATMKEGVQPTRADLDRAARHRPIALTRTCGHMMVVNSRALALAGVTSATPSPPGGHMARDDSGAATGLLQETAMGLVKRVLPEPTVEDYEEMVVAAGRSQLAKGITAASEAGAYADLVEAYRRLDREHRLPIRIHVMAMRLADESVEPLPLPTPFVSDSLRVDSVKLFADGGLSGGTAALREPYRSRNGSERGILRADAAELFEHALAAQQSGLRVCTHAIGDVAIEAVLDAYERLETVSNPRRGHRIEHFGLPDSAQIARAARLGVIVASQTVFLHALGTNFRRRLSEGYLERTYPVRSMLRAGLVVALGSDAPVVPDDNPLLGVQVAVTREDADGKPIAPQETIAIEQALYCYTMGGALASGDARDRGSLSAGKWADMVHLDRDPMTTPVESLTEIRVLRTFVAGNIAYEA
jgi:predicted amidohydrolase YtcJ